MKIPIVSIIVPCWNMLHLTKETIQGIAIATNVPFEVIVVNNGSVDGTKEWLDTMAEDVLKANQYFLKFVAIHNPENRFVSAAINIGLAHSCGANICLCCNDILIPPNFFRWAIKNLIDAPSLGIVSPYYTEDETYKGVDKFYRDYENIPKSDEWIKNWHFPPLCVGRREIWEKVGGWDERLKTHCNDNDFEFRVKLLGYEQGSWKGIICYHQYGSFGRKQVPNEAVLAQTDRRYFGKKWGIQPEDGADKAPDCVKDKCKQGNFISNGQKNFRIKYKKIIAVPV